MWEDYYRAHPAPPPGFVLDNPPDPTHEFFWSAAILLAALVPFGIMTVGRWIIAGRWRLGPRW